MCFPNFAFLTEMYVDVPELGGVGIMVFILSLLMFLGVICQDLQQNNMIYATRLIVWPSLT